jgi:hypothetical protein
MRPFTIMTQDDQHPVKDVWSIAIKNYLPSIFIAISLYMILLSLRKTLLSEIYCHVIKNYSCIKLIPALPRTGHERKPINRNVTDRLIAINYPEGKLQLTGDKKYRPLFTTIKPFT